MSETSVRCSVDTLIDGIRELYNKSKTSVQDMSCDLVDSKLALRDAARKTAVVKDVVRSSKQFEEMFRKRSFYEKMIARSMKVPSCLTVSERRSPSHASNKCNKACSCEKFRSAEISSYDGLPRVLNAPRKLIQHAIGEIVLQLEKRIILHVYPGAENTYYGTLEDLRDVIASEPDQNARAKLFQAFHCRIQRLQPLGWDMEYHVAFGNRMMQHYGVGAPAWCYDEPDPLVTHAQLARIISKSLPREERLNMMTILSCLLSLALEDGRPLFLTCEGEEFQTLGEI